MRTIFVVLSIFIFINFNTHAQHLGSSKGKAAFGIGAGLPYGGLGTKFSYNPADQFAIFAGLGYNFDGFAANVGAQYIFPSKSQTEFYLTSMYGYNAVILIEGASNLNETFSGFSAGGGVRINSLRKEGAFWDIGLLVPARSKAYEDAKENIQNLGANVSDPWPVQFFFGYNFPLSFK